MSLLVDLILLISPISFSANNDKDKSFLIESESLVGTKTGTLTSLSTIF